MTTKRNSHKRYHFRTRTKPKSRLEKIECPYCDAKVGRESLQDHLLVRHAEEVKGEQ